MREIVDRHFAGADAYWVVPFYMGFLEELPHVWEPYKVHLPRSPAAHRRTLPHTAASHRLPTAAHRRLSPSPHVCARPTRPRAPPLPIRCMSVRSSASTGHTPTSSRRYASRCVISPHLPTSPQISPHLPISRHISPRLATSRHVSPHLATSPTLHAFCSHSLSAVCEQLAHYLTEGVLSEEYALEHTAELLHCARGANVTLRWLMLHRRARLRKLPAPDAEYEKREAEALLLVLMDTAQVCHLHTSPHTSPDLPRSPQISPDPPLDLSVWISSFPAVPAMAFSHRCVLLTACRAPPQFEYLLRGIYQALLDKKESLWESVRTQVVERLDELSDAFAGERALSRIGKDEQLQQWFKQLGEQVRPPQRRMTMIAISP